MRSFLCLSALAVLIAGCHVPIASDVRPVRTRNFTAVSQRPDAPVLIRLRNGHYRVKRPWTVEINGKRWQVQKGYTSNGITAPARIKETLGDGIQHPETWAAVFHDWLFTQPGVTRTEADRIFRDLLIAYQVPPEKARLMYTTVSAYSLSKAFR